MKLLSLFLFCLGAKAAYVPGRAFDRFFTIWLENEDFAKVDIDHHAQELKKEGISLTSYYGLTHPSQPNYLASISGDYFGLDHDNFTRVPYNVSTIIDLFDTRDISWRGYFEDIPGPGFMAEAGVAPDGTWNYVRKHDPFVSFDSINYNGTRLSNVLSFHDFELALAADELPQYAHFSPNMLNDGHNTTLEYATGWSYDFLMPLLENEVFMNNTLVLLTYDESETYEIPNHITSILLGGAVPSELKGTTDDTFYTHYSILATLENNWDLPNLGRYDVGANVFDMVAKKTSYKNQPMQDMATVNFSLSYGGALTGDPAKYLPIPPPNLKLIGAGGKGVAESITDTWSDLLDGNTPYDGSGHVYDGGDGVTDTNSPVYKQAEANA